MHTALELALKFRNNVKPSIQPNRAKKIAYLRESTLAYLLLFKFNTYRLLFNCNGKLLTCLRST